MDENVIAWHLSDQEDGYPSGGFYEAVLRAVMHPPEERAERMNLLLSIYQQADERHGQELDALLPGVRPLLQTYYDSHSAAERVKIKRTLDPVLRAMPFVLAQMWEFGRAVRDYAATWQKQASHE